MYISMERKDWEKMLKLEKRENLEKKCVKIKASFFATIV